MILFAAVWLLAASADASFIGGGTYSMRLVVSPPTGTDISNISYGGWLDSGRGCKQSSRDTSIPSSAPLLSVSRGLTSQFALDFAPSMANVPPSAVFIRVGVRKACPSFLTRAFASCPTDLRYTSLPSLASFWAAEPLPRSPPRLGLYMIKAVASLGARCRNVHLGVPKRCSTNGTCALAPQILPGPINPSANLVWQLINMKPPPVPRPSFLGLDLNSPKNFLFSFGSQSASIRYSVLPETRDFQVTFILPDPQVTWFTDKPYHLSGSAPMAEFIKGYASALGAPNVVITGGFGAEASPIKFVVQMSSPAFSKSSDTLTFSATRVGPLLHAEDLMIANGGSLRIDGASVFVDSIILDILFGSLNFGSQVLNTQAAGKGIGWEIASLALVTAVSSLTAQPAGPNTTAEQLQTVANQVQETLQLVTTIDSDVTALLSLMENLGDDYTAFLANKSIAFDVFDSGPSDNPPLPAGGQLVCPGLPSQWTNNILFGSGSGSYSLLGAINALQASIQGASAQTDVNIVAQIFNQAGVDCTSTGCSNAFFWNTSAYQVPSASQASLTLSTMNQYIATMLQGLNICNIAASFASNETALSEAGCDQSDFPNITGQSDYCVSEGGLNAKNLLNETYGYITSAMEPSNMGWGYMWQDFSFEEPIASCLLSQVSPDITDTLLAPPGSLLTALRFNTVTLPGNGGQCTYNSFTGKQKTTFMSGDMEMSSSCWNSNSLLTLEGSFSSPTLATSPTPFGYNWTVTPINPGNDGVGTQSANGGVLWTSNTSQMNSSPLASTCSGGNVAVQYISLLQVNLPEGMYAVGASLITWECSDLPQATFYQCPIQYFNPGQSGQQWVGGSCGGQVKIPGEGDGYEDPNYWTETFASVGDVMGLQLLAANVSFNNITGEMILGPVSKISQAGNCVDLSYFDQTSGSWILPSNPISPSATSTFYPQPMPWGAPGQPGGTQNTPFLQLYTESKADGENIGYVNTAGDSPSIYVENNNGAPSPSFIGGAAIWLKGNRIAIGVTTIPTLFQNEEIGVTTPSSSPPSAPSTPQPPSSPQPSPSPLTAPSPAPPPAPPPSQPSVSPSPQSAPSPSPAPPPASSPPQPSVSPSPQSAPSPSPAPPPASSPPQPSVSPSGAPCSCPSPSPSLCPVCSSFSPMTPTSNTCGNGVCCPTGNCCSQYGFCGNTTDFCGTGCQPLWGSCPPPPPPPPPSPAPGCDSYSLMTPTSNTCGDGVCCPTGNCCSQYGFCGNTTDYCGTGCQPLWGSCVNLSPSAGPLPPY